MINYFANWDWHIEEMYKSIEEKLIKNYAEIDDAFSSRDEDIIKTKFSKIIKELDEQWEFCQKNEYLRKLANLVKANLLLRRGHNRNEHFEDAQQDFQDALALLEREFDCNFQSEDTKTTKEEIINLMFQLNLGKYFRNIGRYGRRSDFGRALDEFLSIRNAMQNKASGGRNLLMGETTMWLEATMNIGRVNKSLYYLQNAKIYFWELIKILYPLYEEIVKENEDEIQKKKDKIKVEKIKEKMNSSAELSAWWNAKELESKDQNRSTEISWELELGKKFSGSEDIYQEYLIQALVQLGIVYRKEKNYGTAKILFELVLQLDVDNVDAKNNKAVCERKERFYGSSTVDNIKDARNTFENLKKENRFAALNYYKCCLIQVNSGNKESIQHIIKELKEKCNSNPKDLEVRLLLGRSYQKSDKVSDWKEAQKIFQEVYEASPYIRKGTIGLKAYFNMTRELMREGAFHQAKEQLEKIIKECAETDYNDSTQFVKGTSEKHGEEKDLLAAIDLAWCHQQLGEYKTAIDQNNEILDFYEKEGLNRLGISNQKKIRHNLGVCYLHVKDEFEKGRTNKAIEQFQKVFSMEGKNTETMCYLAYAYLLQGTKNVNINEEELNESQRLFEQVMQMEPDNVYACSGWVKATTKLLENHGWENKKLQERLERKLKYPSGKYSMRACTNFSLFLNQKKEQGTLDKDRMEQLYRSLARIRLEDSAENYEAFHSFLKNESFRRLPAFVRGRLLAYIYPLYETIMQLKESLRYPVQKMESKPVHYTSLSTLKILLSEEEDETPRMRLWNTAYMNDSFEGKCFLELMKQIGEEEPLENKENVEKILSAYYPHLSEQRGNTYTLPANDSTYAISFSNNRDAIHMWIPYGRDSKGCAITFSDSFFDACCPCDTVTEVSGYSNDNYSLYQVKYLEKKSEANTEKSQKIELKDDMINASMRTIWYYLDKLESLFQDNCLSGNDKEQERTVIRTYIAGFLNEVRFLFKDSEYSYEKEVRMVRCSSKAKTDQQNFEIPRLYIEVNRDISVKEVQLGSKISEPHVNEIVSWLSQTQKVNKVTVSQRHYK